MGVFDQLKSGSSSSSSGGVFGQLKKVDDYHNARGVAEADEQWQVAHQWDNNPEAQAIINPPVPEHISTPDPTRELPIIGPVLKGMDWFAKTPVQHFIADVGQWAYTPGAGLANIGGLTSAAESLVSKALPKLGGSLAGRVAQKGISEGIVGAPLAAGQSLATNPDASTGEFLQNTALGSVLGGALGMGGKYAGTKIGQALDNWRTARNPQVEQQFTDLLALPPGRGAQRMNAAMDRSNLPYNDSPIAGQGGFADPLALPQGNYTQPTRLKVASGNQTLDYVMNQIKPDVEATIAVPTRRDHLITYIQDHLQIPREEIHNMPHTDLQELGQMVRQDMSVYDKAVQAASKRGYDLPSLLEGKAPKVSQQIARNAQERVAGVFPQDAPNIAKPQSFNRSAVSGVGLPRERVGLREVPQLQIKTTLPKRNFAPVEQAKGIQTTPLRAQKLQGPKDELKFAQTVKDSPTTPQAIVKALEDKPILGARTTDIKDRQDAANLIKKHGLEGLHTLLMNKTKQFSSAETVAAKAIADHFGTSGSEEDLVKGLDLVAKTAKGSREMGQAISALRQWKQLDASGVVMLGTKELNRGVKDIKDYIALTPEQAKPLTAGAQRYGTAEQTKTLADEVLAIVTNKQNGEALTDAEKATIKQFQDQVKLINEKGKGILSKPREGKANETIKAVSKIEPKERTRDQVVSFLDAKAEKARQRLAASRNVGFAAINKGNPVADYAIIGASHLAKGVVKLSDFTEQMVKDFGESVKPYIHEVYKKSTNIFRKENGLPTVEELDRVVSQAVKNDRFTKEEAIQFKAWAAEIGNMSAEFKREATQDLQIALKELGDSTLGNKIATLQTGAQLLNVVTVGRNIFGNAALITAEKINKVAAVPIDFAFSKLTGERTIKWVPHNQEKMHVNFMKGSGAGWEGISPTGTLDSYGIHPNVFSKKNPLRYVSKLLGVSMQGFDNAAYRVAYGDVLATYGEQLGKAQGLTKAQIKEGMPKLIQQLDQRIHDLADEAGRYATFQDDTLLSQGADMLKQGLNKITDMPMQKLVEMGLPKKYSLEGFGLGDVVLKYAKTPANLVMRALDYSPVGFVRSIMELAPLAYNRSKFNQFKATRTLSRAITGTLGLTGMGYILADAGILTGSSSMDKDVRSIQEQSGQGAYKVNWSALWRFMDSGFDKEAAKFQKGDNLMDYAWLQPAAISVAMGVNANKAVKDRKNGSDVSGWQIIQKGLLGGLQTVLENPMVQGVSGVVDALSDVVKRQDPTRLKNIGKGVPASFIPTVLNQGRAATDNNQRETFSKDLLTEMGNLMANKVPGLSKKLPISYDSMGNARERIQGGQANTVTQYLTSFFSPARLTEYQVSPEAKLVLDLMNDSGSATVLPRIANKTFHVSQGKNAKDLKVELDAKQFSQLQQNLGQMVTAELSKQAAYLSDPSKSLDSKVKKVSGILTDVGKKARENIGVQMGYKKTDIKS
jgi:hypothetical protein